MFMKTKRSRRFFVTAINFCEVKNGNSYGIKKRSGRKLSRKAKKYLLIAKNRIAEVEVMVDEMIAEINAEQVLKSCVGCLWHLQSCGICNKCVDHDKYSTE